MNLFAVSTYKENKPPTMAKVARTNLPVLNNKTINIVGGTVTSEIVTL